jgi:hypothetical protein
VHTQRLLSVFSWGKWPLAQPANGKRDSLGGAVEHLTKLCSQQGSRIRLAALKEGGRRGGLKGQTWKPPFLLQQ